MKGNCSIVPLGNSKNILTAIRIRKKYPYLPKNFSEQENYMYVREYTYTYVNIMMRMYRDFHFLCCSLYTCIG